MAIESGAAVRGRADVADKERHPFAGTNRSGSTGLDLSRLRARHPVSVPQPSRSLRPRHCVSVCDRAALPTGPLNPAGRRCCCSTGPLFPHSRHGSGSRELSPRLGALLQLGSGYAYAQNYRFIRNLRSCGLVRRRSFGLVGVSGSCHGHRLVVLHGRLVGGTLGPAGTAVAPRTAGPDGHVCMIGEPVPAAITSGCLGCGYLRACRCLRCGRRLS